MREYKERIMKIKQYTATALCAALLVTNSGPWIPLAVAIYCTESRKNGSNYG